MNINSVTSYQSNSSLKSINKQQENGKENNFTILHPNESTQLATSDDSNTSNVWSELSEKYNVRNATFDDIKEISSRLYEAGEISFRDHSILTFDYDRAVNYLKAHFHGKTTIDVSTNNQNKAKDWIAEFENRTQKSRQFGDLISYQGNMNVLNILHQLDHTK